MPIVPIQDNFSVSPAAGNLNRFTATDAANYAPEQLKQMGQALSGAGQMASKAAIEAQDEANNLRVNEAMNKAVALRMRLTYDKAEGFKNFQGKQAIDVDKDGKSLDQRYMETYNKELADITASLGNDAQKAKFNAHIGQVTNQFSASLQDHLIGEQKNYEKGVRIGTIKVAQDAGVQEWNNPDSVAQARGAIVAAVNSDKSLSPEAKAAMLIEATSPLHAGVLAASIEKGNFDYAKEYMGQFGKEMTAESRQRLQSALDIGERTAKIQTYADDLMSKDMPMAEALAKVREQFSGKDEKEAVQEIHTRYQEKELAKTQDVKQLGVSAWSQVMSTGKLTATMRAELTARAPEELRQILDWQDAKRRQAKAEAEGGSAAKEGQFYGLMRMAAENPEEFTKLDLMKSEPYLSKSDFKTLVAAQANLIKGDNKEMESARVLKQTLGLVKGEIAAAGIDMSPQEGTKKAKETSLFLDALTRSLTSATKEKGRPLTDDEARRIGMSMLREGVEQGSGIMGMFQTKKRGYQIATDPNIPADANYVSVPYKKIPAQVRDELLNDYIAAEQKKNPNFKMPRSIYGNRDLIPDDNAMQAIERAYQKGIDQGRF